MLLEVLVLILAANQQKKKGSDSPNSSQDAATVVHLRDPVVQSGSLASGGDRTVYPPNIYAPQAQTFYYRGLSLIFHLKWNPIHLTNNSVWFFCTIVCSLPF